MSDMNLEEEYTQWLISKIDNAPGSDKWYKEEKARAEHPEEVYDIGYTKLFRYLHSIEYQYTHPMDKNRYEDGISLRWHYELEEEKPKASDLLTGPCSMLEMLVALAIKVEEIMWNSKYGDRTKYWFSRMLFSLGLRRGDMMNEFFNDDTKAYINKCLERFFKNEYEPDGHGGLFIVYDSPEDLTKLEIWVQMQRYIGLRD